MKGTSTEARDTNTYLDVLKGKVYEYQQQLIREDELVDAENMRNKILGVEKRKHMLAAIFQQHNDEVQSPYRKRLCTGNSCPIRNFIKTHC